MTSVNDVGANPHHVPADVDDATLVLADQRQKRLGDGEGPEVVDVEGEAVVVQGQELDLVMVMVMVLGWKSRRRVSH